MAWRGVAFLFVFAGSGDTFCFSSRSLAKLTTKCWAPYRHGVEEQPHKCHKQANNQEFDQTHLIVVPQHVLERLQGVKEPKEGGIWPTVEMINAFNRLFVLLLYYLSGDQSKTGWQQNSTNGYRTRKTVLLLGTYLGLSRACGSSRARPAGFCSASSWVKSSISASTLPCGKKHRQSLI